MIVDPTSGQPFEPTDPDRELLGHKGAALIPPEVLNLTGRERAAIMLLALWPDVTPNILKLMPAGEINKIEPQLLEMDQFLGQLEPATREAVIKGVLNEAYGLSLGHELVASSGIESAREALIRALGAEKANAILNKVDATETGTPPAFPEQANERSQMKISRALDEVAPDLFEPSPKHMLVFENISMLDDRSVQRMMKEVDSKELALALKGASEAVKERIFKNMSARAADMVREDMSISGPVRLRNVEEAQQRIVKLIRRLEEADEIVISASPACQQASTASVETANHPPPPGLPGYELDSQSVLTDGSAATKKEEAPEGAVEHSDADISLNRAASLRLSNLAYWERARHIERRLSALAASLQEVARTGDNLGGYSEFLRITRALAAFTSTASLVLRSSAKEDVDNKPSKADGRRKRRRRRRVKNLNQPPEMLAKPTEGRVDQDSHTDARLSDHADSRGNGSTANSKQYSSDRPSSLSPAQRDKLQRVQETFARLLASSLSSTLRMLVSVNLASIEQGIYDEFLQGLRTPTVLNIISLEPLPGSAVLELEMNLAYAFIERLLNGPGKAWNRNRDLTDLEIVLMKALGQTIVSNMKEAWVNLMEIEPKLEDITLSPQFARVALPTESILTVVFEVRVTDVTGTMSLCLPFPVLEPALSRLNPQPWISDARRQAMRDSADLVKKNMDAVKVPFIIHLGGADVGMMELLNMQPGDVIRLDQLANQELEILIGNQRQFKGRPGLVGQRVAIQITDLHPDNDIEALQARVAEDVALK